MSQDWHADRYLATGRLARVAARLGREIQRHHFLVPKPVAPLLVELAAALADYDRLKDAP